MTSQTISYVAKAEPAEEGGYIVKFPDLSGCITEAESLGEARIMAKDAMTAYLISLKKDEMPFPQAKHQLRNNLQGAQQFIVSAELSDLVQK